MTQQPQFEPPADDLGAVESVLREPTHATLPLHKLAPEAALRRLELTVVRRLEGFLHGDHRGLMPGPGSGTGLRGWSPHWVIGGLLMCSMSPMV